LFYDSVLIEPWAVIELAHPTRGEANMGHIGDDTAIEEKFLA